MFKKLLIIIFFIVLTGVVFVTYIELTTRTIAIPTGLSRYDITIDDGQTVIGVLESLEDRGFVTHIQVVRWYLRIHPLKDFVVHSGEYTLAPGMSIADIFASLQGGAFERRLTFLEGWRKEQYSQYLDKQMGRSFAEEFYSLTEHREGMLFPDTYFVDTKTTPRELVEKMINNYESKIETLRDAMANGELSEEEVVVLASIVERESFSNKDRPIIAGIFIKRLKNGWLLDADATVQYAVSTEALKTDPTILWDVKPSEWWPKSLTSTDLEIDSPYNSRVKIGLTPTAISNPGLDSLKAVVYYETSPYWYYLNDKEGTIRFASTLEQHNQNIITYGVSQ